MIFVNIAQAPYILILFIIFSGLLGLMIYRKHKTLRYFFSKAQESLLNKDKIKGVGVFKNICLFIVIGMLSIVMLDPRGNTLTSDIKLEGIDIMMVFDLSRSMDSEDVKPSRLGSAKNTSEQILSKLVGHRIGLVGFAATAARILPLTTDIDAINLYARDLSTSMFSSQSTDIERALTEAVNSFAEDSLTHKAIILFTDGENLDGNPSKALKLIKEKGINLYIIGMGTPEGGAIPIYNESGEFTGNLTSLGNTEVITKLDIGFLQKLASDGNGRYFHKGEIAKLVGLIENFEKNPFNNNMQSYLEPQFRAFVIIALLALLLYLFLPEKRTIKKTLLILTFMLIQSPHFGLGEERSGYSNYQKGDYSSSLRYYQRALIKNPKKEKALFGEGAALYKLERGERAEQNFLSLTNSENKKLRAKALFNAGNARAIAKNYDKAIEIYKEVMKQEEVDSELYKKALNNYLFIKATQQQQQQSQNQEGDGGEGGQGENQEQEQNQNPTNGGEGGEGENEEQGQNEETDEESENDNQEQGNQGSQDGEQNNKDTTEIPSDIQNLLGIAESEERKNLERQQKGKDRSLLQKNKW